MPDGRVGEIWVAGPSVAPGYWDRPEESRRIMGASLPGHDERAFLRSGDLGFLRDGELFVTGRIKDLIIVRGRNVYPQDVEWTVERSHPALRTGGAAAFAVEVAGEERLAIVLETERAGSGTARPTRSSRRSAAASPRPSTWKSRRDPADPAGDPPADLQR